MDCFSAVPQGPPNATNRMHVSSIHRPTLRVIALCLVMVGAGAACATRSAPSPHADSRLATPESPLVKHSGSFVMPSIFQHGAAVYDLNLTSTIEITAGDSLPRSDSSHIRAMLSAFFTPLTDKLTRADVRVDSVQMLTSGSKSEFPGVVHTYEITVGPDRSISLDRSHVLASCTFEQPTTFTGEEILPILPPSIPLPQFWTDTARFELCRGGIRLGVTRIANYRYEPRVSSPDSALTHIVRTTHATFQGYGTQWQQHVEASGTATTVDTLILNAVRLASISGETHLRLLFRSQFRVQEFRQVSHSNIRLRE
jgi:hypothetical protein